MTPEVHAVIIAGGGPAGLSTALHLLQGDPSWADRMLLLEKEHYPREKLCAGGVTRYGEAILTGLGLAIGVPTVDVYEMRVRFEDLLVGLQHDPVFRVTRRAEFDAWLSDCARQRGTRIREGERVERVELQDDGVRVITTRASYQARVLVGADGSKGIVRGQVGLQSKGHVSRLLEVVTPEDPAATPEFRDRFATFDFTDLKSDLQGYYWDFPSLVKGEPFMNRGVFDARTAPGRPRAALRSVLGANMRARGRSPDDVELQGHPIHWFALRGVFSRPGVILVGDAAGADPLLGEGIAMALAYGGVAAGAIEDAFARGDFSFHDYRRRLMMDRLGRTLLLRRIGAEFIYRNLGRRLWKLALSMVPLGVRLLVPEMEGYRVRR